MRSTVCYVGVLAAALAACTTHREPPAPVVEELTCGDSSMPQAVYARAVRATRIDSLANVAIVTHDAAHQPVAVADIQAWGPRGASGQPGNPTGLTLITDRAPGLYSLRIRLQATSAPWIYALTLRPNYLDTVTIVVGTRCTVIWHGR